MKINTLPWASLYQLYHENTKQWPWQQVASLQGIDVIQWLQQKTAWKYVRSAHIPLPSSKAIPVLEKLLLARRSRRNYTKGSLSLKQLAKLLFLSCGITGRAHLMGLDFTLRAYPSAGARYPIEVYPVVFRVQNLVKGLYHYDVLNHRLERLKKGNFCQFLFDTTFQQLMVKRSSVCFLLAAVMDRIYEKYAERSYRYTLIEAGHIGQNFYLVSEAMGLGCCTIGGFQDDILNHWIGLDGLHEILIYIVCVGTTK
jgi:SagB-type dehydrogenase family enzyme